MADIEEIEAFLTQFQIKIRIWDVLFLNRDKNLATIYELGIVPSKRKDYLFQLTAQDYCEGPKEDNFGDSPLWIFGKTIRGLEIYIKVQMNVSGKPVICISFHKAEHPLQYPHK